MPVLDLNLQGVMSPTAASLTTQLFMHSTPMVSVSQLTTPLQSRSTSPKWAS